MKKNALYVLSLLLVFLLGCGGGSDTGGKSPVELIVGKWQNTKGRGAASTQEIFEFKSDGTVLHTMSGRLGGLSSGGTVEGEYIIEGNKIIITYPPLDVDDDETADEEYADEEEDDAYEDDSDSGSDSENDTYTYTFKFLDQNRLQLTEDEGVQDVYIRVR